MIQLRNLLREIKADEVYRDIDAIQTVIDGNRDVAFLALTTQKMIDPRDAIIALNNAINNGLNLIPIKGRSDGAAFVVYKNNKQNATKLANFASSKGGYLEDTTPEEATLIGNLLSYDEEDINSYIEKKYSK